MSNTKEYKLLMDISREATSVVEQYTEALRWACSKPEAGPPPAMQRLAELIDELNILMREE